MSNTKVITAPPSHDRTKFQGLEVTDLLAGIELRIKVINKHADQVQAIAFGGIALAGEEDEHGDARDITTMEMFNVITDIVNRQSRPMLDLEEILAELTLRAEAKA